MSLGAYIGYTLLGLAALAILVFASLVVPASRQAGLVIAGVGALMYMITAFQYFRAVEMGWHLPNVITWACLIAPGILATVAARLINRHGNDSENRYTGRESWLPFTAVAFGTAIAGALDFVSERLAEIPLSWAAAIMILIVCVAYLNSERR